MKPLRFIRRRIAWILAAGVAFAASSAIVASASHYHHSGEWHGIVYGTVWNDFDWHARVESNSWTTDYRYCQAEQWLDHHSNGPYVIGASSTSGYGGTTCNYWVGPSRGVADELGMAFVYASSGGGTVIGGHRHACDPIFGCTGH